ncbi:hypothetical protein F5883DRAFT_584507 [Diaporthe sp. PMI_573]|nr:hypothetical protein F5883DRAFT_584507 [Diaporthaceae sp. PMI_573]
MCKFQCILVLVLRLYQGPSAPKASMQFAKMILPILTSSTKHLQRAVESLPHTLPSGKAATITIVFKYNIDLSAFIKNIPSGYSQLASGLPLLEFC